MRIRKTLSFTGLVKNVLGGFFAKLGEKERKSGKAERKKPLENCLMSAFAMFSLKYASLLEFDKDSRSNEGNLSENLEKSFGISEVTPDSTMRDRLDTVEPQELNKGFKKIFSEVQRGKGLEKMKSSQGDYLISIDGTGVFSSSKVKCPNCMVRNRGKENESYYHQSLCGVLVKPGSKVVLPIGHEAIVNADGDSKNDCEYNASKRLIPSLRKDHPHLKICVLMDGLHAKAPTIKMCQENSMHYIIVARDNDHSHLWKQINDPCVCNVQTVEKKESGITTRYNFANNLELNASNTDVKVNVIERLEYEGDKKISRSVWITDYETTEENVEELSEMGRARWKIENETFNTLKNQGYNYEHNYGHGNHNLSVNFCILMLLAFTVDQALELCCQVFQKAREKTNSKVSLWKKIQVYICDFVLGCMEDFYDLVASDNKYKKLNFIDSA